jgi:predicted phage-related endonuclease
MHEQGSIEWKKERLGKLTASRFADAIAKTRNGWGASRDNYMAELVVERLTGAPYIGFKSQAMVRGTEMEPTARLAYELLTGNDVEQTGFIHHPNIPMSGASADGLVGNDGMIEIKCPETKTHIETLITGTISRRHILQCQWNMACRPERRWVDFVSFDDRMPEPMSIFIKRIPRDTQEIKDLEVLAEDFLKELETQVEALRKKYG